MYALSPTADGIETDWKLLLISSAALNRRQKEIIIWLSKNVIRR